MFKNFHFRYIRIGLYFLVAAALTFLIVFYSVVFIENRLNSKNKYDNNSDIEEIEQSGRVKIQLAGDVVLNSAMLQSYCDSMGNYNFDSCFYNLSGKIDGDLCAFGIDGVVNAYGDGSKISSAPTNNYPVAISSAVRNCGFNTVLTANGKSLDFSLAGVKNNIDSVSGVGLNYVGSSLDGESNFVIKNYNGVSVGILAYADKVDRTKAEGRVSAINVSAYDEATEIIGNDIEQIKQAGAEIIIALMNWGDDMANAPTSEQRAIADFMVKNGVDVISGTHSHVLQPITYKSVESVSGENKNIIVAYSLGNLLAPTTVTGGDAYVESAILNVYIERSTDGKAYISSAECMPIYVYGKSVGNNYTYSVLADSDYISSENKPEIFSSNEDWEKFKSSYSRVKDILSKSSENGFALGLV